MKNLSLAIIVLYFLAGIAAIAWCNQTAESEAKAIFCEIAARAYFVSGERL